VGQLFNNHGGMLSVSMSDPTSHIRALFC